MDHIKTNHSTSKSHNSLQHTLEPGTTLAVHCIAVTHQQLSVVSACRGPFKQIKKFAQHQTLLIHYVAGGPKTCRNSGSGSSMGAALLDMAGLPSWPQAAISSSPLLSLMVQILPAWINTDLKLKAVSIGDLWKRVPKYGLNMIRLTCNTCRRQSPYQAAQWHAIYDETAAAKDLLPCTAMAQHAATCCSKKLQPCFLHYQQVNCCITGMLQQPFKHKLALCWHC